MKRGTIWQALEDLIKSSHLMDVKDKVLARGRKVDRRLNLLVINVIILGIMLEIVLIKMVE